MLWTHYVYNASSVHESSMSVSVMDGHLISKLGMTSCRPASTRGAGTAIFTCSVSCNTSFRLCIAFHELVKGSIRF